MKLAVLVLTACIAINSALLLFFIVEGAVLPALLYFSIAYINVFSLWNELNRYDKEI